MGSAKLIMDGKEYEFPVIVGSEGEVGVDIARLRKESQAVTFDPGYGNTGSCSSAVTFIDGEQGILRYRGYPIEQIAESARFPEVCYLLINGELPTRAQYEAFGENLTRHTLVHEGEKLVLMRGTRNSLISRAGRVAESAIELNSFSRIHGALVTYCAGCMLTVEDKMMDVVRGLKVSLKGIPFLGQFTFGEQGCFEPGGNQHGNLMISVVVFGDPV